MSKIWMPGGAGGGAGSDECTLVKANVPTGLKAVTADSDDEAVEGTLDTETTLADSQALSGQTFLKFNPVTKLFERRVGGMTNRGAVIQELGAGGSYTIPEGFHNGSGKVTAKSLASQTLHVSSNCKLFWQIHDKQLHHSSIRLTASKRSP